MNSYVLKLLGVGVVGALAVLVIPSAIRNHTGTPRITKEETIIVSTTTLPVAKAETTTAAKKTVKLLTLDLSRVIPIVGEISDQGTEVSNKIKQLNVESSQPIYLFLDSPGGSVVSGALVINAIESSKAPVITVSHSLCASMCAMIHQYGAKRYMFDRSIIMFHQASAGTQGSIGQMNAMLGLLTRYINKMESDVAKRQGLSLQEYQQRTASEYWLDSQEAVQANVADGLVDFDTTGLMPIRRQVPSDNKRVLPSYVETRLNTFKW